MGGGGAPKATAEQKAMERAQREQLDKETASSESRLKAMAQKKIGKASLLGTPIQQAEGPAGPTITEGYELSRTGKLQKEYRGRGWLGKLITKATHKTLLKGHDVAMKTGAASAVSAVSKKLAKSNAPSKAALGAASAVSKKVNK